MTDPRFQVFVYGTLKRGGEFHHEIEHLVEWVTPAWIEGFRLYEGPGYPAISADPKGKVHGELLDLSRPEEAAEILDEIEDCPDLYRRERVEIHIGGGETVEAWTYVLAKTPVPGGDWKPLESERWP